MATRVNIIIDQGTDFSTTVNLTDSAGTNLNLTGFSAASQMRKTHSSSNSTAFTCTITTANSTLTLALNNAVTAAMTPGRYVWDAELTASDGTISRILEGMVTVTPEVTK